MLVHILQTLLSISLLRNTLKPYHILPTSTDLALKDFFLYPTANKMLKRKRFQEDEEHLNKWHLEGLRGMVEALEDMYSLTCI